MARFLAMNLQLRIRALTGGCGLHQYPEELKLIQEPEQVPYSKPFLIQAQKPVLNSGVMIMKADSFSRITLRRKDTHCLVLRMYRKWFPMYLIIQKTTPAIILLNGIVQQVPLLIQMISRQMKLLSLPWISQE